MDIIHNDNSFILALNVVVTTWLFCLFVLAVVKQKYDVQVYDEYVITGNTAVLRCQVPSYVADYVMVTSWVQDGAVNIYPNTDVGGKYAVLANGDLYISNAGPSDGYKNYICRTLHRLTGNESCISLIFYIFYFLFIWCHYLYKSYFMWIEPTTIKISITTTEGKNYCIKINVYKHN